MARCVACTTTIWVRQVATDQNQAVVWMADYEPFGRVSVDPASSISLFSRFPGQYQDDETGLYYNYFRDYDPSIGRYIQSDPIGLGDGPNTYSYVHNNPLRYIDPTGEGAVLLLHPAPWAALGKATAYVGSAGAAAWGANEAINHYNESASSNDSAEKARERKEYSRVCKTAIPPTGDPCTDARNKLNRLRQCLQLRERFSRKWFNDGDVGHMTEIQNTRSAIRNLEGWIRDNCGDQCE